MPRLSREEKSMVVSRTIFAIFILAAFIFAGSIVNGAIAMRSQGLANRTVSLGPVDVFALTKQPIDGGGYLVSMRVLYGALQYLVVVICVSLLVAWWRLRKLQKKSGKGYVIAR